MLSAGPNGQAFTQALSAAQSSGAWEEVYRYHQAINLNFQGNTYRLVLAQSTDATVTYSMLNQDSIKSSYQFYPIPANLNNGTSNATPWEAPHHSILYIGGVTEVMPGAIFINAGADVELVTIERPPAPAAGLVPQQDVSVLDAYHWKLLLSTTDVNNMLSAGPNGQAFAQALADAQNSGEWGEVFRHQQAINIRVEDGTVYRLVLAQSTANNIAYSVLPLNSVNRGFQFYPMPDDHNSSVVWPLDDLFVSILMDANNDFEPELKAGDILKKDDTVTLIPIASPFL